MRRNERIDKREIMEDNEKATLTVDEILYPVTLRLDEIERQIKRINRKANQLLSMSMSKVRRDDMNRKDLENLLREAQENTDAVASVEKAFLAMCEEVRSNVDEPEAVKKILDTFESNTNRISKLVFENTQFQPSGQ